jgi:hypothetical protein
MKYSLFVLPALATLAPTPTSAIPCDMVETLGNGGAQYIQSICTYRALSPQTKCRNSKKNSQISLFYLLTSEPRNGRR